MHFFHLFVFCYCVCVVYVAIFCMYLQQIDENTENKCFGIQHLYMHLEMNNDWNQTKFIKW